MQFLSPIWFFALAALGIPLVIHLWNIRPGKTLKVGSISLITEASKSSSRSLKLLNILLLILRCLLLFLLAAFLAAPVWQSYSSAKKSNGWLLIPKGNFNETYQKFKPVVDSLTRAGYEFHYLSRGFTKQDINKLLADTISKDTNINSNYWTLVKELDRYLKSAEPVYIFTPNGVQHFRGSKPTVHLNLKWRTYTAADSVSKWIASAAITNSNSIKVIEGNSSPGATVYVTRYIQNGSTANYDVTIKNGQPYISLKNGKQGAIAVDTSALHIAIYTDSYLLDAKYLKAALAAATAFNGTKAVIRQYSNASAIPAKQSWLFWLSEKPVPIQLAKQNGAVFKYAGGKVNNIGSWINPGQVALFKRTASNSAGELLWKDGFGNAVLSRQANIYQCYTHFNPSWNDLVWSDEFPKLMLKLLSGPAASQPIAWERRILNNRQLQPEIIPQNNPQLSSPITQEADISRYFWLLLVVVFAAERILNHKIKQQTNG